MVFLNYLEIHEQYKHKMADYEDQNEDTKHSLVDCFNVTFRNVLDIG